jgi:hypothetical protein
MVMLQMVGQNLRLGDLEAMCRESLSTDGGEDASAVDCSPAAGMPIAMACSQETNADAMFCESACFQTLSPWYEECSAEMPTYLQAMLAVPLGLMGQCDEAGPGEAVCDMVNLMAVCGAADSGMDELDASDTAAVCANACIQQIFPCSDNPMLALTMGPEAAASFAMLDGMCNGGEGGTGPGDGICEIGGFMAMSADPAMSPDACGQDFMCMCNNGMVQEMIDCVDDPMMADNHDDIVAMDQSCTSMTAGSDGTGPGDGICEMANVMNMMSDPRMDPDTCGDDTMCLCNNAMIQEMMDCQDNPMFAEDHDEIAQLESACVAITGPGGLEGAAGDSECNEMSASMLCDDSTLEAVDAGQMSGQDICSHPCAQEMMDCVDSPVLAEQHDLITGLIQVCRSEQAECLPIVANLQDYFDEACCTGALEGQCEEGPPPTCTTGCSAMYLPFWSDCGDVITGLGAASPDFAETATGMQSFYDMCRTAHPGKTHGGGH